ncbi:helix-turn-helix transcriptional regulator [Limibacter armeniacum]|uniref:helix-turn-helix domain-containing protein n=1 Tax=Limibacter armeniacum TaxID=466084 RepID=UPI002FE63438
MEFEIVTPEWLKTNIKKHNLTLEQFAEKFGNSRGDISAYCSGKKELSKLRKAAFYYFFKYIEAIN